MNSQPGQYMNLVDVLRWRATRHPGRNAFTFLFNGESESTKVTYGELDRQAQAIAVFLQQHINVGARALLLYPPGIEFISAFCGCLYAGVIPIPAPPADPVRIKRTLPRLQAIIDDAQAAVILGCSRQTAQISDPSMLFPIAMYDTHWVRNETMCYSLAEQWQPPSLDSGALAYLQYTSGSTSTPKGVMVSHSNLVEHSRDVQHAWGYTADSIALTWVPHFHDYGLVDGLLQPLYTGIPAFIMSPVAFYMKPLRWLQAISRYSVTHSQGPNFAYEHCLERIKPDQCVALDLGCWRTASNGSEPIRYETIERFVTTFRSCGFRQEAFYPAYGLAEATLLVSTKQHRKLPSTCIVLADALEENRVVEISLEDPETRIRSVVSCGVPIERTKVVIVNPTTLTRCSPSEVGEVWVLASGVALGYWNKPEESEHIFHACLGDSGEGPFLRTGDLGFMKNDELYITGRIKDVIIIRGRNHYPQDVEKTVEQSHPALRQGFGAAFSVEVKGKEELVVVQEVMRSFLNRLNTDDVMGNIREAISEHHELQVFDIVLVTPGTVPKTSSGKIQRSICRQQFLTNALNRLEKPSKIYDVYSL